MAGVCVNLGLWCCRSASPQGFGGSGLEAAVVRIDWGVWRLPSMNCMLPHSLWCEDSEDYDFMNVDYSTGTGNWALRSVLSFLSGSLFLAGAPFQQPNIPTRDPARENMRS